MSSRQRSGGKCGSTLAAVGALALAGCIELAGPAKSRLPDGPALAGARLAEGVSREAFPEAFAESSRGSGSGASAASTPGVTAPAGTTASGSPFLAGDAPSARPAVPQRSPSGSSPQGNPTAASEAVSPVAIGPPPPPIPRQVFLNIWKIEDVPSELLGDLGDRDTPEVPPDPELPEAPEEDPSKDAPEYADSLRPGDSPQIGPGERLLQWARDKFEQMERAAANPFAGAGLGLDFGCPRQRVIEQRLEAERP